MLTHRFVATAMVAAAALATLLVSAPAAPAADLRSQLEEKESKLEEVHARKGVLTTTIADDKARIERLTRVVAAIRTREAAVRAHLAAKQAQFDRASAELRSAEGRLDTARVHLRRALVALRQRLIAIYESGDPDVLSVILSAGDVGELAARTEYLNRLHGQDEAVASRVRDLRDEVRDVVVRRRDSAQRIESARDAIAAEGARLSSTRAALASRQRALVSARARREDALAQVSANEEELDGSVSALQGEIAAELAETGSAPLPAGPIQEGSGGLIWPVTGPIASGFGPRNINGSYEYHPGIDIAVPEGTPIRAAAAGTVALQQSEAESGGYGNYTCIDHGGGLSTCYAHQSRFAVSLGAAVSQGEVIGYTGCTGYCLGPHLHFEVRIFGQVTDPMGYL
ncbi:MAG TPA: peptidoglycan DD-metalloendopeptidase family protein [Solirubrobacterales bacterium]|nr:peptidoglycan DD-metalloendopeptidase family protein [Solirubrobacterales bacterium]